MTQRTRVMITGLNALTGWHIYRQSSREGYESIGTYRKRHAVFAEGPFHRVDMDDPAQIHDFILSFQPHIIVHARGICDLDLCEEQPAMAESINVRGTALTLEAAQLSRNLKKFVYLSTDHVFDGEQGGYTEASKPRPKHAFGRSKYQAEQLVVGSGLAYIIVRPGLVLGDSAQGTVGPQDFLLKRLRAGLPTHYFTDEWRTPIQAETLARQVLRLACSPLTGIFHVAGSQRSNRYDIARQIAHDYGLSDGPIHPRLRREDRWARIRPKDLTLKSDKLIVFGNAVRDGGEH